MSTTSSPRASDPLPGTGPSTGPAARRGPASRRRGTIPGALAAEALKLVTVPVPIVLAIASFVTIAVTGYLMSLALIGALTDPRLAGQTIEATTAQFVDSVLWAQLLIAVLAALAVTSEYDSGQVRISLVATPTRWPWLAAKTAVLAALGFVIGVLGTAASFAISVVMLGGTDEVYPFDLGTAIALSLGSGAYLAAIAALCAGIAALVRRGLVAVLAVLALLVVVPAVLGSIPPIAAAADFTPTHAGRRLIASFATATELAPWAGYAVLLGWVAAALAGALVVLRRRDA